MEGITRYDVNEEWAHSGMIRAGDFCFLNYCAGNVGGTVEEQINGAFDEMERRLAVPRCMEYPGDGKSDKRAV